MTHPTVDYVLELIEKMPQEDRLALEMRIASTDRASNDRHLLALNPYEGISIISMAEYRRVLEDQGLFI